MSGRTPAATGNRLVLAVVVGVVGLGLIGYGQLVANRRSIEENLMNRSVDALDEAGLTRITADFTGRDATVSGSGTAADLERASTVVKAVDGVRVVRTKIDATG